MKKIIRVLQYQAQEMKNRHSVEKIKETAPSNVQLSDNVPSDG